MIIYLAPTDLSIEDLRNKEIQGYLTAHHYRTLCVHPSLKWKLCTNITCRVQLKKHKNFWKKHKKLTEVIHFE